MCISQDASAEGVNVSADVGIESRVYLQSPLHGEQDSDVQLSLPINLDWSWSDRANTQQISIRPFFRVDSVDSNRTHFDLREAYWVYQSDSWELLIGLNKVYWGVAESRHLVDIINQTDHVEDPDQEDRLGQPMINVGMNRKWGKIELYVLPYFRERSFSSAKGRLREPLPVDESAVRFESSSQERHIDYALRYSHYIADFDIGTYYFNGTSREPRFELNQQGDQLSPIYDQIQQYGLELQYTSDAWLWKLESVYRNTRNDSFYAAVVGLEYTIYQVFDSNVDWGILLEYLHDDRGSRQPPTNHDHDLFVGSRISLNDAQDTALLAGVLIDFRNSERFINIEAQRRIGSTVRAELLLRLFAGSEPGTSLYPVSRDDYFQLNVIKYF